MLPPNRVVEVLVADRAIDEHFPARRVPMGRAHLDRAGAGVIVLGEQGQAFDPTQNRDGRDGACTADRPTWSQSKLASRQRGLGALADMQAAEYVLIRIEFDRGAAGRAEEFAIELAPFRVEKGSADRLRLVGFDVAEERQHCADARMPAQRGTGDVVVQLEATRFQIHFGGRSPRANACRPQC
jgi:hypothetical protein